MDNTRTMIYLHNVMNGYVKVYTDEDKDITPSLLEIHYKEII